MKEHYQKVTGIDDDDKNAGKASPAGQLGEVSYQNAFNDVDDDDVDHDSSRAFDRMKSMEMMHADQLSRRLLDVEDDDSVAQEKILEESLQHLLKPYGGSTSSTRRKSSIVLSNRPRQKPSRGPCSRLSTVILTGVIALAVIWAAFFFGVEFIGPPSQPVGPYTLVERQEGNDFFEYYTFFDGPDSVGSNGYNSYVSQQRGDALGIVNVTHEVDELNLRHPELGNEKKLEPFVYIKSAPTVKGPRESIRLEGKRRFNRGLFIIDVRHMPVGCGVWPAFWLTDEANWPINGEIDIVEGVNYQSMAKTALHTTKGCNMDSTPLGVMTGTWDTAIGVPDKDTGLSDYTKIIRSTNCWVYSPHQWLNQGCVAVDAEDEAFLNEDKGRGSLGIPLNNQGGGVFALEWDPVNRHIRTWVFTPHSSLPENLAEAIQTADDAIETNRVMPDPDLWPLPYGYFGIGGQTDCPSKKFRNMRLVLNTAFCGSVSGNRFQMDCKNQSKVFDTCNEYVKSQPEELDEAYWKIRGVYVYQRAWEKAWTAGK